MDARDTRGIPAAAGLYDPSFERDNCGIGFVAHIKGVRSHGILQDGLRVLRAMEHRGACGCEQNTGDGAGVLTALPEQFLRRVAAREIGCILPATGRWAAGNVFLPTDIDARRRCKEAISRYALAQGLSILGWRKVPVDAHAADLGAAARRSMPHVEQLFIAAGPRQDQAAFERQLYVLRKRAYHELANSGLPSRVYYVCSLSSRIFVYKGLLTSSQLQPFYPDLSDPDFSTHLAMVHARFSTNTFPSWERAQPMRFLCHNGEINTLKGNINWMRARQGLMRSDLFGDDLARLQPVMDPGTSDSGVLDNVLELLVLAGRPLAEAMMMMIPEAWQNAPEMSPARRAFYEYHSCLMEPWDGPAAVAFTDGRQIGAMLDRNGLRPGRWQLLRDNRIVLASETGVLPVEPGDVLQRGRLQPGRMLLVDFEQGRVVEDEEIKETAATRRPYGKWLRRYGIRFSDLPTNVEPPELPPEALLPLMRSFGFTQEHLQMLLLPMVTNAAEPLGSMGNDAPLACLSDEPRLLFDYFKQLFAQVTNPPIDSIRERIVMSRKCYIGPEGNILATTPGQARRLFLPHPVLTNRQLVTLKHMQYRGWKARTIDITWARAQGPGGLVPALERICREAEQALEQGFSLVILSDRAVAHDRVPIPSLLATGAVHHHLVRRELRTRVGLVVESGEAREVHHHCLLVGFGADGVGPWVAFEAMYQAQRDGLVEKPLLPDKLVSNYLKAVAKGMRKVMGKMGISTLQSYKGAQIFEAVGISAEVVERCFAGTPSRIGGVGFEVLAEEALRRHEDGFPERRIVRAGGLRNPGEYHWRSGGEQHAWNPPAIAALQSATRGGGQAAWEEFRRLADEETRAGGSLRGQLRFRQAQPVPLDEVQPARDIVRRFCTGAMSFGSISAEAHETLALAMNRIGGKSNTGEGGEDYERFVQLPGGDSRRSAIKQIASGRFGVTMWYLVNADELQIKMAQGAKPGEGGELPGHKVSLDIARTRHSTPGVGLISPPPHHDIYSIEDLAQLIYDLKNANPDARVSVKLVSEVGVGTVAAGVAKARADVILVSGHEGGTGASPLTGIKHAGLPWELGLAETHQTLVLNDLRSRVVLQTDGQLKTGRDLVVAALLGAEEFGFATAPLIALGCIMMRKCHLNTCPVGIATQDPELRRRFAGKPEHVINYFFALAEDARRWLSQLGLRSLDEAVGRVDLLETDPAVQSHWKARRLDLTPVLTPADKPHPDTEVRHTRPQTHDLSQALDNRIIELARPALDDKRPVRIELPVRNVDRTVGTLLSSVMSRRHGEHGLPDDTIRLKLTGSAGQSLAAWLAPGITVELEGDANDYVGKGLSGGRVIVYPSRRSAIPAERNIIVGNVALYGAVTGEAFFRGQAAERFCVRNSGATAVVEGTGDHGCEYMTGGRAVVLGPVGRNFAAGMSGGLAYVYDPADLLSERCNMTMVEVEPLVDPLEIAELRALVARHFEYTQSSVAERLLADWEAAVAVFRRVIPTEYKHLLETQRGRPARAVA